MYYCSSRVSTIAVIVAVPNSSNVVVTDFSLSLILKLFGYIILACIAIHPCNSSKQHICISYYMVAVVVCMCVIIPYIVCLDIKYLEDCCI